LTGVTGAGTVAAGLRWLTYRWPGGTIRNEAEVHSGLLYGGSLRFATHLTCRPSVPPPGTATPEPVNLGAMTRTSDPLSPRPAEQLRADARQNHARLIAAATAAVAERGADAPLEDIARRAGVGIGTLYRHFPTR